MYLFDIEGYCYPEWPVLVPTEGGPSKGPRLNVCSTGPAPLLCLRKVVPRSLGKIKNNEEDGGWRVCLSDCVKRDHSFTSIKLSLSKRSFNTIYRDTIAGYLSEYKGSISSSYDLARIYQHCVFHIQSELHHEGGSDRGASYSWEPCEGNRGWWLPPQPIVCHGISRTTTQAHQTDSRTHWDKPVKKFNSKPSRSVSGQRWWRWQPHNVFSKCRGRYPQKGSN